jgi:hypothetical protein
MWKEGVILKDVADPPPVKRHLPSVTAVTLKKNAPIQADEAPVGASQSGDATERQTLARSRWTKEHQHLSIHLKGDVQREFF